MSKRLHILIAEQSEIIRCGISTLLQRMPGMSLDIVEINDISTVSSVPNKQNLDIIIVNPSQLGMYALSQFRSDINNENIRILALQNSLSEQHLVQNYDGVIALYDSSTTIKDKISQIIVQEDDAELKKELSQREKEIIVCVVKGMTNKIIADTLSLSTHTVITHRRNIASKLQIHSPSGLTIYAIVNKLVDLADIKDTIISE